MTEVFLGFDPDDVSASGEPAENKPPAKTIPPWKRVKTVIEETPTPQSDVADCPQQIQAATGAGVPDIIEAYQASIEDSDGTPANVNVVNQLTKADIADGVAEGIMKANAMYESLPNEAPAGDKKTRKKIDDSQYHRAIKLVIDEKMPQWMAETECELWQGALSTGKGAKMLDEATRAVADIERRKVGEDVGNDFQYNEARYNADH